MTDEFLLYAERAADRRVWSSTGATGQLWHAAATQRWTILNVYITYISPRSLTITRRIFTRASCSRVHVVIKCLLLLCFIPVEFVRKIMEKTVFYYL